MYSVYWVETHLLLQPPLPLLIIKSFAIYVSHSFLKSPGNLLALWFYTELMFKGDTLMRPIQQTSILIDQGICSTWLVNLDRRKQGWESSEGDTVMEESQHKCALLRLLLRHQSSNMLGPLKCLQNTPRMICNKALSFHHCLTLYL